jgi:glutamate--cysteine ligase
MGLLYDAQARAGAYELVRKWTFAELLQFQGDVARTALSARGPGGATALALARELLALARAGLGRWAAFSGCDDRRFLDPLDAIARDGRTLAERVLDEYKAANRDPASLIRAWAIA